ncbi:hypothetical protein C1I98_05310 [Spongiactinospora gelatinilytica]|uniref:Histidine kinase/HSP90-like ATPase domain-containing protein n=1 Tax=Spongiactinospora gelatinilytica TaxID=2666298 RepID=A0A2W2I724_9ACTN|nr:ATP-binding protein [Spongiactinospora gelatinilytica]PZG53907.1 hypothetical protein C1I98_05310 [Spongiactinospora gelatinilytica]
MTTFLGMVRLPAAASSVPVSRAFVRAVLTVHGYDGDEYSVVLVISELMTNAVIHGARSGRAGDRVELHLTQIEGGTAFPVSRPGGRMRTLSRATGWMSGLPSIVFAGPRGGGSGGWDFGAGPWSGTARTSCAAVA